MVEDNVMLGNQKIPIYGYVDVLVCGGGVAGIAAAVSAAKTGARTLLVERSGFLGGTATGSMMGLIVIPFRELVGFPRYFFEYLAKEHGAGLGEVVPWDTESYKLAAIELVVNAGVDVLLYTWISEPLVTDSKVQGVIIENKSGRQAILAKTVIDTSGDGDVAARAGADFTIGREQDGAMRPVTVMGRIGNVNLYRLKEWVDQHPEDVAQDPGRRVLDTESGIVRIDGFFSVVEEAKRRGILPPSVPINYLRFSGIMQPQHMEHAILINNSSRLYNVDGTNARDITQAEIEGRRQLRDITKVCQSLIPGFEDSFMIDTSSMLGVRETRRIKGLYTLGYDDIANHRSFDDSVAVMTSVDYGNAEIHGPEKGHEGSAQDVWARKMVLNLTKFEFPMRCLIPQGLSQLLVAGRCASVTHDADKFTRNMGPVSLMGQAAGTMAGMMAVKNETDWRNISVAELRQRLLDDGVPVSL
ncbi:FAD-dependent oxidoreductase [Alicyclobacillus tolerans]|uniref:FAD-dependent oxidoreductase n=1 Tax=Alicyclobacillus tolerans TaxID=90970 RepID=UPI001F33290D|nr:FAD-dependent oxidoreductase [Alicyclobacillus tolerans]MCF8565601.1 FAD-dependent oxidoreductase [Alicyclobacillus tolerans]